MNNNGLGNVDNLVATLKAFNRRSIQEFIFIFIISLGQIIFGGVFIEGLVNRELKEEDLVANLNVTSSFTIFLDVLFFMLTQKCFELQTSLILLLNRHKKKVNYFCLGVQLATAAMIVYFGVTITVMIMQRCKAEVKVYYSELVVLFVIIRCALHAYSIKRQLTFFRKQLPILNQIA